MKKKLSEIKNVSIGIAINLIKLLTTRLLIQASSGGGKSYLIRKLCEICSPFVQTIIIDTEGEFFTLREKFPFALVAKNGDIPLSVRYAETLAHKLLETNLSAIIDLSEMDKAERKTFVKRFFHAMIESPRRLWHPVLVILDEADAYAPEGKKNSEGSAEVIDMSAKGRKRGFCLVAATQRVAKLEKDVTSELLNKLIGLTGQDIDRKRAGEELGFASKEDTRKLLQLSPGEFYAIGPAVGFELNKFQVEKAVTKHIESGTFFGSTIPIPDAIKSIVGKLQDIPEEAEKEISTKQEFIKEISRLKTELSNAKRQVTISSASTKVDDKAVEKVNKELIKAADLNAKLKAELKDEKDWSTKVYNNLQTTVRVVKGIADKITQQLSAITVELPVREKSAEPSVAGESIHVSIKPAARHIGYGNGELDIAIKQTLGTGDGAFRILRATAMFYPLPVSKVRIGALASLVPRGGSWNTYISKLRSQGYISGSGRDFLCTKEGYSYMKLNGGIPALPPNMVAFWRDILGAGSGAGRILTYLESQYPNPVSKEQIGENTNMVPRGGSWNTYMSKINSNGLIVKTGQGITLSPELYN